VSPVAHVAAAQATTGPAVLYADLGTRKLATVAEGTVVAPAGRSGPYVLITLRGYIATSLLGGPRDSFPVSVTATDARLRTGASTSAPVAASVEPGMGLHVVKRRGRWTQVERTGWIRRSALPATRPAKGARRTAEDTTPPSVAAKGGDSDAVTPVKSAGLSAAPGVAPIATIEHGAVLTPLARERGWVRVRMEGWVREADVAAADSSLALLSAADLRASPTEYVGRLVRWTVTALAYQTADPLRHDMKPDEPYLLARGPGGETSLLYLTLPPDLVARAKALPPMTPLIVTARVRTGRSDPAGVPILDVLSMTEK
jgi:Bacterial SH3 domain